MHLIRPGIGQVQRLRASDHERVDPTIRERRDLVATCVRNMNRTTGQRVNDAATATSHKQVIDALCEPRRAAVASLDCLLEPESSRIPPGPSTAK
jgi:hypothetical protein